MASPKTRHESIIVPLALNSVITAVVLSAAGVFFVVSGWWPTEISLWISKISGVVMLGGGLVLFYYLLPARRMLARLGPKAIDFNHRFVIPQSETACLSATAEKIVLTRVRNRDLTILWIETPQSSIKLAIPGPRVHVVVVVNAIVEWARARSIDVSVVDAPDGQQ